VKGLIEKNIFKCLCIAFALMAAALNLQELHKFASNLMFSMIREDPAQLHWKKEDLTTCTKKFT